ncbi:MAG: hypothetical protein ACYDBQ_06680 [Thermoplasmatota archaeon]
MRPLLTLALLLLVPLVAASPPGPVPGQDPVSYATGYYGGMAAQATTDPTGFAQSTATPAAVGQQASNAGFIACWQLYDTTGTLAPGCDRFFTPPTKQGPTAAATAPNSTAVKNRTLALVNTTVAAVQQIAKNPTQAPTVLEAVAGAVVAFVTWLTAGIVAAAKAVAGGGAIMVNVLQAAAGLLGAAGLGMGRLMAFLGLGALSGLGIGARFVGDAIAGAAVATVQGAAAGALAALRFGTLLWSGGVAAAAATGSAVSGAATALVRLSTAGLRLFGEGASAFGTGATRVAGAAAQAVGSAVRVAGDAVAAAARAVGSLFGGAAAPKVSPAVRPVAPLPSVGTGLLDGLTRNLP